MEDRAAVEAHNHINIVTKAKVIIFLGASEEVPHGSLKAPLPPPAHPPRGDMIDRPAPCEKKSNK
eukprot:scaffold18974_cov132-Skeletonema_marinoi.AAC.8